MQIGLRTHSSITHNISSILSSILGLPTALTQFFPVGIYQSAVNRTRCNGAIY